MTLDITPFQLTYNNAPFPTASYTNHIFTYKSVKKDEKIYQLMLILFLGNKFNCLVDNEEITLYYRDLFIVPSGTHLKVTSTLTDNNSHYLLTLSHPLLEEFVDILSQDHLDIRSLLTTVTIQHLSAETVTQLCELFELVLSLEEESQNHFFISPYYLLKALRLLMQAPALSTMANSYASDKHFSHIVYYIDQHYRETDLQLERLTSKFSLSTYYFSRLFRKEMQTNFHQYLILRRIQYAAK